MKCRVGFVSLGCPKNLTDTETMIGILSESCQIVQDPAEADIIIVNTCGFIESAKQESINAVLEMTKYKTQGKLKKLIMTGCLAERYSEEIIEQMPEVDAIVGTGNYFEIEKVVNEVLDGKKTVIVGQVDNNIPEGLPRVLATEFYSAYLKIADGCDNNCTYCVIPKLRGKYRSRKMEDILKEAELLVSGGVSEIIIIAQDITRYGIDLYDELKLPYLLHELGKIDKIHWIRLHYCYPELVSDELIEEIATNNKICKYIDIPFQHASDRILKRMNRRVDSAACRNLVAKLRDKMPDIVIRSTFITGFPGESEEDFNELKDFITKMRLDRVGVFAYSEEEGTPAAEFPDQIKNSVRIKRRNSIMKIQSGISLEKNREKISKVIEVLCVDKLPNGKYVGRSSGDSPEIDCNVIFAGDNIEIGQYVDVIVTSADEYDLKGVNTNNS